MIANDHYQVLETISDNPIKAVYRCTEASSAETVILKVLKSEFAGTEAVMRFKQEYKLLTELSTSTEGVIRPLRLEEQNGLYVMVLEDIAGRSLKRILAEEQPEEEALLKLAVKVVDILGSIHEQNVIHKDIKPSNIIWNPERDIVQVIDFDLAVKLSKERRDFQNSGVLEGSLPYISPEQTGRMNRNIDYRSDYYSLGVVLYEMMTGIMPYPSSEMLEQIYSIIAKEALSPYNATGGRVSIGLSAVIMKLMEKSSEDRYRSAHGIKAESEEMPGRAGEFRNWNRGSLEHLPHSAKSSRQTAGAVHPGDGLPQQCQRDSRSCWSPVMQVQAKRHWFMSCTGQSAGRRGCSRKGSSTSTIRIFLTVRSSRPSAGWSASCWRVRMRITRVRSAAEGTRAA